MAVDIKKVWAKSRDKPNVVGYSGKLHKKVSNGREKRGWAVRIYVTKKLKKCQLQPQDLVPELVDGVETDIVEVGEFVAETFNNKTYMRPTPAGVSAVGFGGTACTLGWFARDNTDGEIVIVANNHCTCAEGKHPVGHTYVQTSHYDKAHGNVRPLGKIKRWVALAPRLSGNPLIRFLARFYLWFMGIPMGPNRVDIGIVSPDNPNDIVLELYSIGALKGKRRGTPGELLEKVGRTTGHTKDGLLLDNDYYGTIKYRGGYKDFGPVGLVRKTGFTDGGDSSSVFVWMSDKKIAGIGFAGSGTHSMFCHYDYVEEEADVTFIW